jgi:hypothetical protein
MKIIDATWRHTNTGVMIGIVLVQNDMRQVTCRIGTGSGYSPGPEAIIIANLGSKLDRPQALAFFPDHKDLIWERWKKD